jgi:hypothetical protein
MQKECSKVLQSCAVFFVGVVSLKIALCRVMSSTFDSLHIQVHHTSFFFLCLMLIALSRRAFVRVPATRCLATLTQHCSISNAVPFVSIMSRLQPTRLGQSHHMSSASKSVMFSTSSRPPLAELSSARVHLTHRSIISVSGSDTVKFLQNLVTADVRTLESARCLYTTFLNSKGRFLADAFLYAGQPLASGDSAVLIDCASAHVKALLAHLNMFRIRARVNVVDVSSSHSVYALLQADTSQADLMAIGAALCPAGSIVVADPRTSNLGVRVVTSAGAPLKGTFLQCRAELCSG